jgi:hypothetical protein
MESKMDFNNSTATRAVRTITSQPFAAAVVSL